MRNCSGPEVILGAFQLEVLADATIRTHELKQNDILGKYDNFHYILIEDHQR